MKGRKEVGCEHHVALYLLTAEEKPSQHGGAERPEPTFQEHINVTTTCGTTTDEKTRACQRRSFTTKDVKEDPQHDEGKRWIGCVKSHIPRWGPQDKHSA